MQNERDAQNPRDKLGIRKPGFKPFTREEAAQIRGGGGVGAGLCPIIGYACNCKGGFGIGICFLVGVSTSVNPTSSS